MKIDSSAISDERGYTLIETVLAMAIFLSVLIPLLVTLGAFLLDKKPTEMYHALRLAESELSRISIDKTFVDDQNIIDEKYLLDRQVIKSEGIARVNISVLDRQKNNKVVLKIQKSFIYHE